MVKINKTRTHLYLSRLRGVDSHTLAFFSLFQLAHQKDVLLVVERAKKDVAIESLLNMFEEVWLSRQLELKEYKRVVDSAQQEVMRDSRHVCQSPGSCLYVW